MWKYNQVCMDSLISIQNIERISTSSKWISQVSILEHVSSISCAQQNLGFDKKTARIVRRKRKRETDRGKEVSLKTENSVKK